MKIKIELKTNNLDKTIHIVDEFCRKYLADNEEFCFKVRLVYEELITNIFKHAVKHNATFVDIEIEKNNGGINVGLLYDGEEFDPTTYRDKRIDEPFNKNKKQGGLGLFLVSKFSKSFTYRRSGGVNFLDVEI